MTLQSRSFRSLGNPKTSTNKKKTVDRLLKKQDPKTSKGSRQKVLKKSVPLMSYFNNKECIFLSLPEGVELPFISQMLERKHNELNPIIRR
ncbi:hypothetical protein Anas_14578 [Armadillidium nasatum]|uniref:Uncharacterized protein n=1 Tax=Armadillidium nasatum TaxID=96803 RepID=A0A5N5T397_9CRUS|nr:hypothetical protein Anas_14578 [Armadillidium nasatum]